MLDQICLGVRAESSGGLDQVGLEFVVSFANNQANK